MKKTLCVYCQVRQTRKHSNICQTCFDKQLKDSFKDIDVSVPESKWF